MLRFVRCAFLFNLFLLGLFSIKADFFSEQLTALYQDKQLNEKYINYWGGEFISGYTLEDIKKYCHKEIEKPEAVLFGYILLQNTEKYCWQYNKKYRMLLLLDDANKSLGKNNIKKTFPWDNLSSEIYKNLSYYDKREALAQKIFYDRHDYYCEEDPQAPEQMEIDAPEFQSILTRIDEECDIKSIYSSEAFENAYQSLSASISSESGDSSFGK